MGLGMSKESGKMDRWSVIYFQGEHVHSFFRFSFFRSLGLNVLCVHAGLGDSKFLIKICWYVFLRFSRIFRLCFFVASTFDGPRNTSKCNERVNWLLGVAISDEKNKWKIIKFWLRTRQKNKGMKVWIWVFFILHKQDLK